MVYNITMILAMLMPYVVIFVCSVIDHLFTWRCLAQGGGEANPVMAVVMPQPFWVSFIIKNGWTALLLILLYHLAKRVPFTVPALRGAAVIYLCLIGWHVWGFLYIGSILARG